MGIEMFRTDGDRRVPAAVLAALLAAVLPGLSTMPAKADTALGAPGHYLKFATKCYLHNPDGRAFELTVHRFEWVIEGRWNQRNMGIRLTGPDKRVITDKMYEVGNDGVTLRVPNGAKGTYLLEVNPEKSWRLWYVTCSLDRSVAYAGPGEGHAVDDYWFAANPFVPRRWWFFVPVETKSFRLLAQRVERWMSQREDYGLVLISPRGQRVEVLWGQENPGDPGVESKTILVEPGSAGRFWAVEVRFGDAHKYSDVNLSLDGVPPYLARSPEEWFDPWTDGPAPVRPYDEAQFLQSARNEQAENTNVAHWMPCPSLGDPSASKVAGPAAFALWNPEGRELAWQIGTYLERRTRDTAELAIAGPQGKLLVEKRFELASAQGWPDEKLPVGRGVYTFDVRGAEHFFFYTYPATPLVLIGRPVEAWRRFTLEVGGARNWYFYVPKGVETFRVRAAAGLETDVVHLEINAPDRTLAMIYDNQAEKTVRVPPGLDGKIWHVRVDVGSATEMFTRRPKPRCPAIRLTLDLEGVPGFLAPTWEQWFDPDDPKPAIRR